jgi:hypothetical protein
MATGLTDEQMQILLARQRTQPVGLTDQQMATLQRYEASLGQGQTGLSDDEMGQRQRVASVESGASQDETQDFRRPKPLTDDEMLAAMVMQGRTSSRPVPLTDAEMTAMQRQAGTMMNVGGVPSAIEQNSPLARGMTGVNQPFTPLPAEVSLAVEQAKAIRDRGSVGSAIGSTALGIGIPAALSALAGPEAGVLARAGIAASGILGAGAGGVGGELAEQKLRGEPIDIGESLHRGLVEAGYQIGGEAVGRGISKTRLLFKAKTIADQPEAARIMQDFYDTVGGVLTPAQRVKGVLPKTAEDISRGAFFGKEIFDKAGQITDTKAMEFADAMLNRMANGFQRTSPEVLGDTIQNMIVRPVGTKWQMLDDLTGPIYDQIEAQTKGRVKRIIGNKTTMVKTNIGMLPLEGRGVIEKYIEGPVVKTDKLKRFAVEQLKQDSVAKHLTSDGRRKLQDILDMPKEISFGQMRLKRSALLRDERKMTADIDQSLGLVKKLAGLTNASMEDEAVGRQLKLFQSLSPDPKAPDLYLLWKNTNAVYRAASEQWEDVIPKRIVNMVTQRPEQVSKMFPRQAPKKIEELKRFIQGGVGTPDAAGIERWNQMGTTLMSDWIGDATKTGAFRSHIFERHIKEMGKEAMGVIYNPEQLKAIDNVVDTLKATARSGSGSAGLFVKGMQIGGAVTALSAIGAPVYSGRRGSSISLMSVGAGLTLAISPVAFARLAVSNRGSDLLTWAVAKAPKAAGTKAMAVIAGRLSRELVSMDRREQVIEQQERLRAIHSSGRNPIKESPSVPQLRGFGGRGF